ncbi:hypothetical protein HU200_011029 [Digitaria exilis]|uniref:Gnk2-homologous domain-containing protein n=1 Tax=Digitaria exilis TaxID=1010633 RepID=A0A835FHB3_9POAL|nr:hypothetical protein HU200_011029 [Digitaria exilis]
MWMDAHESQHWIPATMSHRKEVVVAAQQLAADLPVAALFKTGVWVRSRREKAALFRVPPFVSLLAIGAQHSSVEDWKGEDEIHRRSWIPGRNSPFLNGVCVKKKTKWPMSPARLLLLIATVAIATAADDDRAVYLNYTCSATGNYSDDSPFGKNLAELLPTLSLPARVDNWWFRRRTVGQASGLAMCFADSEPDRCLNCLYSVSPDPYTYRAACDHSRDVAFISSDGCVIRYAGEPFFGSAANTTTTASLLLRNTWKRAADTFSMNETRRWFLTKLAVAAGDDDDRRFATGSQGYNDTVIGTWQVMYGMAQCMRTWRRASAPPA